MANKPSDKVILSWIEEDNEDEVAYENENASSDSETDAPSEHSDHPTDTEQSEVCDSDMEIDYDVDNAQSPSVMPCPELVMPSNGPEYVVNVAESLPVQPRPDLVSPSLGPQYVGKDGITKWYMHNPNNKKRKTRKQNIITKLPGVKGGYKTNLNVVDCWKIFFPDETLIDIVASTNSQLSLMQRKYTNPERDCRQTDMVELLAFFGVLYMLGVKKTNHSNTSEMWVLDGSAPEFFRAVMSEKRFHQLYQAIRFDDRRTRHERKQTDNLAPIRGVFEKFVERCIASYTPGEYCTIDEMLEGFRGRCKFRQYIRSKPDKYGIKIYALVDSRTFFTVNMEIYAGKQPKNSPYELDNSAAAVVERLIKPIDKSARNITMDNYFTSIPLANDLFAHHKTTIVGTIRKNKAQLPANFLEIKQRPVKSSIFGFGKEPNNTLLVSYVPKKNKNVLMLSTLHDDDVIDPATDEEYKPEVITFYNVTKGGVDVVDRKKKDYSVKRVNNRWPLAIFCGLLDLSTVNAQIIYFSITGDSIPRRKFIKTLAMELVKPHLIRRASVDVLSISLRQSIKNILGPEFPERQRLHVQGIYS